MPLFLYEDVHEILVCIATESIEGSGESVHMCICADSLVYLAPLAAEGAMCTFHTFEKTRFKICSLLKIRFAI